MVAYLFRYRWVLVFVWVFTASPSNALTTPTGGAAALPSGLKIHAPFPCGTRYVISCSYGCGMHAGTNREKYANDYYANDFNRSPAASGYNQPVTAVAAGKVRAAGWTTGGFSSYGIMVVIEHDFTDGHRYSSIYAHLANASVQVGDHVERGATIGLLGASSNGSPTGGAWHLHFAMHRDATTNTASGGEYGGVAVVPEPLGGATDLSPREYTAECENDPDPPPKREDQGVARVDFRHLVPRRDSGGGSIPQRDLSIGPVVLDGSAVQPPPPSNPTMREHLSGSCSLSQPHDPMRGSYVFWILLAGFVRFAYRHLSQRKQIQFNAPRKRRLSLAASKRTGAGSNRTP